MDKGEEIFEPYQICYSDLISLSSSDGSSSCSIDEVQRLEIVVGAIIENLGPGGPGLLTITGVPGVSALRDSLLPAARGLALLHDDDRKRILKEHGLGSDVPLKNLDRIVTSFAIQLKYEQFQQDPAGALDIEATSITTTNNNEGCIRPQLETNDNLDKKFENLSDHFKKLGFLMMSLGLRLARICDRAIGGHELEKSLLEAGTAKGRLVHYHAELDTCLLKGRVTKRRAKWSTGSLHDQSTLGAEKWHNGSRNKSRKCFEKPSELWQQWHYDYGIFTILTSPMFTSPRHCPMTRDLTTTDHPMDYCKEECLSPSEHSCLQIFDPNKNAVRLVKTPLPDSFIVQVGESANILSRGRLRSTLHCVGRPQEAEDLSRETFVVFLQPAWTKVLNTTDHPMEEKQEQEQPGGRGGSGESYGDGKVGLKKLTEQIHGIVPPLSSRLRNGMTFAEFARETTRQYYGGGGLQPNR